MAYYDFDKKKGFAIISNSVLRDKKLSLKAKAVFSIMITLPKEKITVENIAKHCKETPDTISKIIKELEAAGYVTKEKSKRSNGTIFYDYDLHQEPPKKNPAMEEPLVVSPPTEKSVPVEPSPEKPVLVEPPTEKPVPVKPLMEKPVPENAAVIKQNININKLKNKYIMNEDKEKKDTETLNTDQIAEEVVRLYNTICTRLKGAFRISDKRKKLIDDLLSDDYSIEDFKIVFEKANSSDFLNQQTWADLEWLLDPEHFLSTLEGKYDNSEPQNNKPSYDLNEVAQRSLKKYKDLNNTEPSYRLADMEQQSYNRYKAV